MMDISTSHVDGDNSNIMTTATIIDDDVNVTTTTTTTTSSSPSMTPVQHSSYITPTTRTSSSTSSSSSLSVIIQDDDKNHHSKSDSSTHRTHHIIHRYIPAILALSLQSDAPGYYDSNQATILPHQNPSPIQLEEEEDNHDNHTDDDIGNITLLPPQSQPSYPTSCTSPSLVYDPLDHTTNYHHHTTNYHHRSSNSNSRIGGGPICWKCRGTGQKRNHHCTTTPTKTKTTPPGDGCTVCHGRGRIMVNTVTVTRCPSSTMVSSSILQYALNNSDNDIQHTNPNSTSNNNTAMKDVSIGLITRGRRRRRLPFCQNQLPLPNVNGNDPSPSLSLDSCSNNNTNHIDPVGYVTSIYGPLVQQATTQCTDIRILYHHHHHQSGPKPQSSSSSSSSSLSDPNNTHRPNNMDSITPTIDAILIGNPIKDRSNHTRSIHHDHNDTMNSQDPNTEKAWPNHHHNYHTIKVPAIDTPVPSWLPIRQDQEQLCNLVGHWRILQRYKSHRYTTDDVVTAMVATRECFHYYHHHHMTNTNHNNHPPISYCDLGTGNGSVLQMVLWKIMSLHNNNNNNDNTTGTPKNPEPSLPFHIVYGFEAREEAVGLLQRSLDFNIGIQTPLRQRVHIVRTDFRSYNNGNGNDDDIESHDDTMNDVDFTIHQNQNNNHLLLLQNQLDVVTGTPPYFQVDFHIPSSSTAKTNSSTKHTNCHNQHSNTNQPNSDTIATKVPVLTTSNNNKTATTDTNIIATIRQGGMPLSIQSAPARCEFRGGIEAYCQTASYLLRPGSGMLCICENYHNHNRAIQSFRTYHFHLIKYYIIEGKVGRGPLFCVYVARKIANPVDVQDTSENVSSTPSVPEVVHLAVRDENGEWTKEYQHMVLDYMSILH